MTENREVEPMTDAQYTAARNDLITLLEEIAKRTITNPAELEKLIAEYETHKK